MAERGRQSGQQALGHRGAGRWLWLSKVAGVSSRVRCTLDQLEAVEAGTCCSSSKQQQEQEQPQKPQASRVAGQARPGCLFARARLLQGLRTAKTQ